MDLSRHDSQVSFTSDPITSFLAIETSNPTQASIRDVTQFFELENIGIKDEPNTKDDDIALEHFYKTLKFRDQRYYVSFPWNEYPPAIPTNYGLAKGRLNSLLKNLRDKPELLKNYHHQIMLNLQLGIIEQVPDDELYNSTSHYIPHHGVIQEEKLRIVYDASAKTHGNPSLNECIHRGPLLLENLCGLLMEFRFHPIVILADIERAFLELGLNEEDRNYVRFLWINEDNSIVAFRFKRVPFGVIASPFLLNAVVKTHIEKSSSPITSKLKDKWYVDNLITESSNEKEALEIYKHAKKIFHDASMNLRHWTSNSKQFCSQLNEEDRFPSSNNIYI